MTDPIVLTGERVVLRPFRKGELDELERQSEGASSQVGGKRTREQLRQKIDASGRFTENRLELALEAGERLIGSIQARAPEKGIPAGVCELGIEIVAEMRSRGIGTEAVALLTEYLLANGYPRVQASTDVGNVAMRRALERAGFDFEGVMRAFMPEGDGRADYALYARTA